MNRLIAGIFLCLGMTTVVLAQESDLFKLYKGKFPDAPAVFVERSEVLSILVKNDSLEMFADVLEDMLHLKPQTDVYAAGRVYGSHFIQVKDLKAKLLLPVHWAKFLLSLHAWNEPIERVVKAAADLDQLITTPMIGEPFALNKLLPENKWW